MLLLPNEIIQLILCEISRIHPNTVASIAACNRRLHDLVHSIWRDIFLAAFDDPRLQHALQANTTIQPSTSPKELNYDWTSFTRRIAAANALARNDSQCDFLSLVEVISTTQAVPPEKDAESMPSETAIVFPPLLRRKSTVQTKNMLWLEQTLANGYPSKLLDRFLQPLDPTGELTSQPKFEDGPQGRAFNKLVFLRGFIPDTCSDAAPEKEQRELARAMARKRVYNTKYLTSERMWGPFQPLDNRKLVAYAWRNRLHRADCDAEGPSNGIRIQVSTTKTFSSMATDGGSDSDDDPDYVPANGVSDAVSDDDSDDGILEGDIRALLLQLLGQGLDFMDDTRHPTYVFPAPHRVVPDFAFLASARLIIEANMRDIFEASHPERTAAMRLAATDVNCDLRDIVDAMQSLDLIRMGGAPGFWRAWSPSTPVDDDGMEQVPDKGKGKEKEIEYQGWDWAGVEGEWRRVVCWLDYRDLLLLNVDKPAFSQDHISETTRIFPMTLRVARYEPPPRPPHGADPNDLIWRLPIIHVVGESRGTDMDIDLRRVIEGTVRMVGDGAVRWSMTSGDMNDDRPEWVTESVQIGGIGSAIGIIGLWTGAEHSPTDPIGPCWAWKLHA
uniref:F-box domain-containing protein n=1 Tax=Mycena chlorophos TaxID=658473 RepID=A0ABQ0KXP1_MYCCL|nr:predicted protein [Mycena chlorophos]